MDCKSLAIQKEDSHGSIRGLLRGSSESFTLYNEIHCSLSSKEAIHVFRVPLRPFLELLVPLLKNPSRDGEVVVLYVAKGLHEVEQVPPHVHGDLLQLPVSADIERRESGRVFDGYSDLGGDWS